MNPQAKARAFARKYALQALYQWQLSAAPPKEIEMQFLKKHQMSKKTDFDYFKELLHEVPKNQQTLDECMTPFLNRDLHELDPIELATLRLSIYELMYRLDIPFRVVINEGLELTKMFGSSEGYKFVNSVLDQVARKVRQPEISASKKTHE